MVSLFVFISATKFSIAFILSKTFMVGQIPFPLSNASHAESNASIASFFPKNGISPNLVGLYFLFEEIVE